MINRLIQHQAAKRFLFWAGWMLMVLAPQEAKVSQVMIQEIDPVVLADYLRDDAFQNQDILLVQGPIRTEVFKQETFPKATHYLKQEETMYQDFVEQYRIESVLRSDRLKKGDAVWVYREPAYAYDDIKQYHEEGLLGSPVVLERKTRYPIQGDRMIVFLRPTEFSHPTYSETYHLDLKEGPAAAEEIVGLLSGKKKKWWRFW